MVGHPIFVTSVKKNVTKFAYKSDQIVIKNPHDIEKGRGTHLPPGRWYKTHFTAIHQPRIPSYAYRVITFNHLHDEKAASIFQ